MSDSLNTLTPGSNALMRREDVSSPRLLKAFAATMRRFMPPAN